MATITMAGLNSIDGDDSRWPEVEYLNRGAVFMGYLQIVVRALGLLVFTWATVVLLGGFVSNLSDQDFWCLATITLVQSVRNFDFVLKELTSDDLVNSMCRLLAVVKSLATPFVCPWPLLVIGNIGICVVSPAVLYFVGLVICMWLSWSRLINGRPGGYGILTASDDDKKEVISAHLKSALTVLYALGIVQGFFFFYINGFLWRMRMPRTGAKLTVEWVAEVYRLDAQIVSEYLDETMTECMKQGPSFARGRNLVTYAVPLLLMGPTSATTSKYLSGLAILGSVLQLDDDDTDTTRQWLHGQATMTKQLLAASSFGQVTHRLLETLGPASPYSGAVRQRAARVLEEVTGSVRLEEFPGATQCIASLLGTFEEHCWRPEGYERDPDLPELYERGWLLKEQERRYILENVRRRRSGDASAAPPPPEVTQEESDGEKSRRSLLRGYVGLAVSGLRLLQALAAGEDNCSFISGSTRGGGEVSRAMRPLASEGLHGDHHDEWCIIAEESLKLLSRLMAAPGETGKALRVQIAGDTAGAVAALQTVLGCPRCQVALKRRAVEVLLGLPPRVMDTSSIVVFHGSGNGGTSGSSSSSTGTAVFMGILLHIFLLPDKHLGGMSGPTHVLKKRSCTRRLAGEKLLAMVSALQQPSEDHGGGATATSMLQAAGVALGNLTSTVVGAGNDASWRIHAGRVLQDLCQDYTKVDEYLKKIKKAICLAMPEVIKQLLDGCVSTTTQAVTVITEAKKIEHCQEPAAGTDLEQGAVSDNTIGEEIVSSPPHQQAKNDEQLAEGMELYQALVSLCHGIPNSWIDADKELAGELNGIAAEVCAKEGMPFSTFISLRAELKRRYCWEEKNERVRAN